ncbi:conserved hypothetical protein [Streptomyces sviceus ATCC 29083]|uniref:Uncharacterized protein n=1 Tax=Streptomyces sviceus (strain ATCC 29083 / DSM 924 / JCM 4929 / NBRC 13980 / NCIMB 11184 / NRRL 5439 / UC 5370) TaxID=463191 RepID=B5HVE7_STRX2|nr:conserved hypothetical protein [Streptomyces sviceus ATCC 29083]
MRDGPSSRSSLPRCEPPVQPLSVRCGTAVTVPARCARPATAGPGPGTDQACDVVNCREAGRTPRRWTMSGWQALPDDLPPEVRHFVEQLRQLKDRTGLSLVALGARTAYSKSSWHRYLNATQPRNWRSRPGPGRRRNPHEPPRARRARRANGTRTIRRCRGGTSLPRSARAA